MSSPFAELSSEEWHLMMARSSSGEHPVFTGEKASGPQIDTTRHTIHSGQFFEVDPEKLIEVAKHMAHHGDSPQQTIQKAYSLICEAHLTSRNIKHWNEKTRRGHVSKKIHDVVNEHEITEGKDKGKVPRKSALSAFLKAKGLNSSTRHTSAYFNQWVRDTLRHRSFTEVIPWHPNRANYDEALASSLRSNGWISEITIGTGTRFILPKNVTAPHHKSRRKIRPGEHVTRPWWGTKNVWWPEASSAEVKTFKGEYLVDNSKHFQSAYVAMKVLEKFDRWLDIIHAIENKTASKRAIKKGKRDPDTGKFT